MISDQNIIKTNNKHTQLIPSCSCQRNTAQRTISSWQDHFIVRLSTTDDVWYIYFVVQTTTTIRLNHKLSTSVPNKFAPFCISIVLQVLRFNSTPLEYLQVSVQVCLNHQTNIRRLVTRNLKLCIMVKLQRNIDDIGCIILKFLK